MLIASWRTAMPATTSPVFCNDSASAWERALLARTCRASIDYSSLAMTATYLRRQEDRSWEKVAGGVARPQ